MVGRGIKEKKDSYYYSCLFCLEKINIENRSKSKNKMTENCHEVFLPFFPLMRGILSLAILIIVYLK